MTIDLLRKQIHVFNYEYQDRAIICYILVNKAKYYQLGKDALYDELVAIGSIEDREQFDDYSLSQWDALSLVIRHEYELSLEKDSDMMNLNNAIDRLKQ